MQLFYILTATTHHCMAALADLPLGDHAAGHDAGAAAKNSADLRLAQRRSLLHSGQLALHHGPDVVHDVINHPVRPHVHACMQRLDSEPLLRQQIYLRSLLVELFGSLITNQAMHDTEPLVSKRVGPALVRTKLLLLSWVCQGILTVLWREQKAHRTAWHARALPRKARC